MTAGDYLKLLEYVDANIVEGERQLEEGRFGDRDYYDGCISAYKDVKAFVGGLLKEKASRKPL